MIEIRIPKDVRKYEPKLIGPFNKRQAICLGIFTPVMLVLFNIVSPFFGNTIAAYTCFPVAGLAYLFGWVKPYGMGFEQFLASTFINNMLAPSNRKVVEKNYYAILTEAALNLTTDDLTYLDQINEGKEVVNSAYTKKIKKKSNSKKQKYVPSKKAIF